MTFVPPGGTAEVWSTASGGVLYDGAGTQQTVGSMLATVFKISFTGAPAVT